MLLTITTTESPATDLGYLLHKHPARVQGFDVSVGRAHVFYPEATEQRCTAALLLDVDPIALVRGRRTGTPDWFTLGQYVNDRPYAASSMLAVALGRVFKTAMSGRCDARPDLLRPRPLRIHVPALPCEGGAELARRLFGPLGWSVAATAIPLDPLVPEWGDSRYVDLTLTGEVALADALHHLYVLLPTLDNAKHYWVGSDEVDKLVRAGGGWLSDHPDRDLITRRYLAHQRDLVATAVTQLAELDGTALETGDEPEPDRVPSLRERRLDAVLAALRAAGASRVADLGCGEGSLIRAMIADPSFTEILGADVSVWALRTAARRAHLDTASERTRQRVRLVQSALTYRDDRLTGFDAAVLAEVIEHVDPARLPAVERSVFGHARPTTVVVTTPNAEYNVRFSGLSAGTFRHRDHRFEWTRDQFREWAEAVADAYGYQPRHLPVGEDDPEVGPPTQMAVFTRVQPGEERS